MADSDEEIMKQHEKLFEKLDQGTLGAKKHGPLPSREAPRGETV